MAYVMVMTSRLRKEAQRKRAQRNRTSDFGDGYSQVTVDGLNPEMDEWMNVGWDFLTDAELVTARAMLDGAGTTDYITWTPAKEAVQKKYRITVDGYTETYVAGGLTNISFNLKQIP